MAVVVVAEVEGGNEEFYEKVSKQALPGGELPDGAKIHIAGPTDDGWRVITVWESQEHFERFREETLIPALRDAGEEDRIAPRPAPQPVHRLITA